MTTRRRRCGTRRRARTLLALKGHTGGVTSVAFSPDGTRIVTGSWRQDGEGVGRADRARHSLALKGHTSAVTSVAFSPDGTRIVTGSEDKTAKVWDARTGTAAARPQGAHERGDRAWRSARTARASSPAVRTRRRRCGTRGRARPCSPSRGTRATCSSVAFSPDGTRIVTGSWDTRRRRCGTRGPGTPLLALKGHTDACDERGVQPGRHAHRHRQSRTRRRRCGTRRPGQPSLALKGHTGAVYERGVQPGRHAPRHRQWRQDGEGVGRADRARPCSTSRGTRAR